MFCIAKHSKLHACVSAGFAVLCPIATSHVRQQNGNRFKNEHRTTIIRFISGCWPTTATSNSLSEYELIINFQTPLVPFIIELAPTARQRLVVENGTTISFFTLQNTKQGTSPHRQGVWYVGPISTHHFQKHTYTHTLTYKTDTKSYETAETDKVRSLGYRSEEGERWIEATRGKATRNAPVQ